MPRTRRVPHQDRNRTTRHENPNLARPHRPGPPWWGWCLRCEPTTRRVACRPTTPGRCSRGSPCSRRRSGPCSIQHCLDCHGGKANKGDLDLSDREPLVESGVLEGGGKESRLAALIRHEDEPHMPQKAPKLPDATIADIARWIDLGAPYDRPLVDRAPTARRQRPARLRPTRTSGRSGRWPAVSPPVGA